MTLVSIFIPKQQMPEILAFFSFYYINLSRLPSLLTEMLSTSIKHLDWHPTSIQIQAWDWFTLEVLHGFVQSQKDMSE
jgi:hypothetical protein